MKEENEVNMKEAADNVILLDEAVFERIVGVLCEVLHGNKYPEERRKILGAIAYAQQYEIQEMQEQYRRQQMAMQQAVSIRSNTGSGLQNNLNPYSNTASIQSIQDQLNYQKMHLENQLQNERQLRELQQAIATQQDVSFFDKFKFW